MKPAKGGLGELEREVMRIMWSQGGLTAEAVREKLRDVDSLGVPIEHVVNNAGVGGAGHFSAPSAKAKP